MICVLLERKSMYSLLHHKVARRKIVFTPASLDCLMRLKNNNKELRLVFYGYPRKNNLDFIQSYCQFHQLYFRTRAILKSTHYSLLFNHLKSIIKFKIALNLSSKKKILYYNGSWFFFPFWRGEYNHSVQSSMLKRQITQCKGLPLIHFCILAPQST